MGGPTWEIHTQILTSKRVAATAVGYFNVTPGQVWSILTVPEGADIFRVESRQQLEGPWPEGIWEEEVVFTAAVRVLFWKTTSRTRVRQRIDASSSELIKVDFSLMHSGLMSHLKGSWELQQMSAASPSSPAVTKVTYRFEMWPKGVPTGLRFMPGLMQAVEGAVSREAAQLLDKLHYVANKVRPGVSVHQAVREVAGEVLQSGGSFKLLQQAASLQKELLPVNKSTLDAQVPGGSVSAAAAAAAVQCHALADEDFDDDAFSEEAEGSELSVYFDNEGLPAAGGDGSSSPSSSSCSTGIAGGSCSSFRSSGSSLSGSGTCSNSCSDDEGGMDAGVVVGSAGATAMEFAANALSGMLSKLQLRLQLQQLDAPLAVQPSCERVSA